MAPIYAKNKYINTPLHRAVFDGHLDVYKLLIQHGADVNTKNEDGWTPLYWAVFEGYLEICKVLIEHGSDVNVRMIMDIRL